MKSIPKFRLNSLYTKLFLSFIIIILPIQLLGFLIFQQSKNALEEEIKTAAAANVSFLTANFNTEIKGIEDQLNLLVNSSDTTIREFYVESDTYTEAEYWLMLREIITKLALVRYSSDYIQDIILYYPTQGLTVSTVKGVQKINEGYYSKDLAAFYTQGSLFSDSASLMSVGKLYPSSSYMKDMKNNSKPIIFLKAVLSTSAVEAYLGTFSTYNDYPTMMVNYNTNAIICDAATQKANKHGNLNIVIPPNASDSGITWTLQKDYYVVSAHSSDINCSFIQYLPITKLFRIPRQFSIYNLLFILLSIPVLFIYSIILYRLVKSPIDKLIKAFHIMRGGNLNVQLQINSSSSELIDLLSNFNDMTARLNTLIDKIYKQEIYTRQIEFKQLQSQINPHFLYNSFFTLSHLIQEEDNQTASRLANYLGGYFQYITKTGIIHVLLQEEFAHTQSYLQIQQMRFPDRLQVELSDVPEWASDILVPRLILQPILENSIEHGMKGKTQNGLIRLTFEQEGNNMHIITEDNGENIDDATIHHLCRKLRGEDSISETTGLINIHRRLQLAYGIEYGITVGRSILGGLRVDMKILAKRNNEKEGI